MALVWVACSGKGTAADGSASDEGGPSGATGFVPRLGVAPDAALPGPRDPVRCGEMGLAYASAVAYSPDGALLAVAGPRFRLLDTSTWQEVRTLDNTQFRTRTMDRLAFAASGTVLLGMRDDQLGVWRVDDGAFLYSLDLAIAQRMWWWQRVAPSNTPLLALTDGKTAALWDMDKRAVTRWVGPTQGNIVALALSEKADMLGLVEGEAQAGDASVAFTTTRISLWDTGRARLLQTIPISDATVTALALSPDADTLAVVEAVVEPGLENAYDTWVRFYCVADGQLLRHTAAWRADQGYAPTSVGYLPGGDLVAASSAAGLWLIRASDAAVVNVIPGFSGNLAFSPDGKLARTGNSIEIRNVSDGTILDLIPAVTGNQAPTFSPDGQFLASADYNDVVLWRVAEGAEAMRFAGLGRTVQALAFSPDGRTLASGGKDAMVRIWSLDRSTEPLVVQQGQPVTSVAFSPDGSILATADGNGNIYIRDTTTWATANVWYGQGTVSTLAFSPDGRWLVSGGTVPALRLWEVQTGMTLASAAHGAGVVALAFSPDGSRLASAAKRSCGSPCPQDERDADIMIWRVTNDSLSVEATIPTFPQDPEGNVPTATHAAAWGLAFAPDGKTLLTAGPQNAGHIYQVPEGALLASFGSFYAGTSFAVSPDATRIVTGSSPIEIWCAAGATGK